MPAPGMYCSLKSQAMLTGPLIGCAALHPGDLQAQDGKAATGAVSLDLLEVTVERRRSLLEYPDRNELLVCLEW